MIMFLSCSIGFIVQSRRKETVTYWEEIGFVGHEEENYGHEGEIASYDYSCGENFTQLPTVGHRRWLDSIFRNSHNRT